MLTELSIFDVVLIDRLNLSFGTGLTAMTGETGAGKSIVLDALGLALGARADRSLVRAGCKQAQVVAVFSLELEHPVWAHLKQRDIDVESNEELILRRVVTSDGKSSGFINDIRVSASVLREIGNLLVEIHGQHDGRGLMDSRTHIKALDAFGDLEVLVANCAKSFQNWVTAKKQADLLERQASSDSAEQVYLQEAANELDRVDPQPGEEQSLAAMRNLLMQSEQLLTDIDRSRSQLENSPGPSDQISTALRSLETALSRFDPGEADLPIQDAIKRTHGALERSLLELDEAHLALQDAAQSLSVDPNQLEDAEERLFALRALARKHKVDVDQLPNIRHDLTQRLQALENLEQAQIDAARKVSGFRKSYEKAARKLSEKRRFCARKLDKAILQELAPLRLDKAKFETRIETLDVEAGGPSGIDRVGFEISANPGTPIGPLSSIASGGELSRISLAIKVSLVGNSGPGMMVFDEIDQGVGGAVADAVGRRLATLSKNSQVLVITHSPQVAARAAMQFQIKKSEQAGVSVTDVVLLNDIEREEEIARMLAGAKITNEARDAAKALLT